MSKLQPDQDSLEDTPLEEDILSALRDGFLQLETPTPSARIEANVKEALTSGTDFDPLPRQIGRRVVWTVVPAFASFLVVTGILALRPIPRIPINAWRSAHGGLVEQQLTEISTDRLYETPAPLPRITAPPNEFLTQVHGIDAPVWFRKPMPPVLNEPKSLSPFLTNRIKGKVTHK